MPQSPIPQRSDVPLLELDRLQRQLVLAELEKRQLRAVARRALLDYMQQSVVVAKARRALRQALCCYQPPPEV